MKNYKTFEVVKMLSEDNTLKFTDKENRTLTSRYGSLECTLECTFNNKNKSVIDLDKTWELVQEPVDFMVAAKAFSEGKNVRVEFKGAISGKPLQDVYKQTNKNRPGMCSSGELSFYRITTGKWYLELEE